MKYAIILVLAIFLPACSSYDCDVAEDCRVRAIEKFGSAADCFETFCTPEGKCLFNPIKDCCGNGACENEENKCSCQSDCGVCSGKIKYNITDRFGREKEKETIHAVNTCQENICVVSAEDSNPLKLANTLSVRGTFDVEALTTINQPFVTSTDTVFVRLSLKDLDDKVSGSLKLGSLQLLSDDELLGEVLLQDELSIVGSSRTYEINLTTGQELIEETRRVSVKVDFEYTEVSRGKQETVRKTLDETLPEKIVIIK